MAGSPLWVLCEWLALAAPEPPASEPPPIQRPSSLPPPQPVPVETPPLTTPPIEATPVQPTPVEPPSQPIEPPPPTTTATTPPSVMPRSEPAEPSDELASAPKPSERRISPAFRRPGVWVGTGAAFLAIGTVLHFIFPTVTKNDNQCGSIPGCHDHEMTNAGVGILILSVPVDGMTLVSFGFAGRSYGLRGADGRGKAPAIGVGVAFAVAGAALEIASLVVPFKSEELNEYSYGIAAMREAAIVAGSAGAFLLGYGIALPAPRHTAAAPRRRLALAPSFGRAHIGLALTIR